MSWYTASNSTNQIAEQLIYGELLYYNSYLFISIFIEIYGFSDAIENSIAWVSLFFLQCNYTGRSQCHNLPLLKMQGIFRVFFCCRKCDFRLRHRGLRIAQWFKDQFYTMLFRTNFVFTNLRRCNCGTYFIILYFIAHALELFCVFRYDIADRHWFCMDFYCAVLWMFVIMKWRPSRSEEHLHVSNYFFGILRWYFTNREASVNAWAGVLFAIYLYFYNIFLCFPYVQRIIVKTGNIEVCHARRTLQPTPSHDHQVVFTAREIWGNRPHS